MKDIERIQGGWNDGQDVQFFNITSSLFSPSFCYGASVLLASYDSDEEFVPSQALAEPQLGPKREALFIVQPSA